MGGSKAEPKRRVQDADGNLSWERTTGHFPRSWNHIKHFRPRDFTCRCDGFCDHTDVISLDLVRKLDKVRDMIGMPITIISGTRCARYHRKVSGAHGSPHLARDGVSHAAHVRCPNASFRFAFLAAALPMFRRIGIGRDSIHVDDDPSLPANLIWLS